MNLDYFDICKICGEKIENDKHFWRTHKINLTTYFQQYYPRFDLTTKEQIPFKNKEQYFSSNFINKNNLKTYLKSLSLEQSQSFCCQLLIDRKERKGLIYSPCQVELRSLIIPNINYYNKVFQQGYYGLCEELGFKNKFVCLTEKIPDSVEIPKGKIIIDSRERCALKLKIPSKIEKLDYGDYYFPNKYNIYIERKAIGDFLNTMSKGYDRFCREIERATQNSAYLIILVEEVLSKCLSFNYLPWVHTKVNPEFIWHRVRELLQKYPNIQFLFADGRLAAVSLLMKIFFSGVDFRNYDMQLALDLKLI